MRKRNLKVGTYNDNNRGVKRRRNSSGVTGVSWTKNVNRWHAYIGYQGKHISLGYFDKLDEAVAARKKAEKEYGYPE